MVQTNGIAHFLPGCSLFARICLLFVSQKTKKLEHHQHQLISHCQNFDFLDEKKLLFVIFQQRQFYYVSISHKEVAKQDKSVLSQKTMLFQRF